MAKNNLGLPYKGSKNTIAHRLIQHMPGGGSFIDACCGGGAVLEAAYMSDKYSSVVGMDIDSGIVLLLNAVFRSFGLIDYEHRQLKTYEDFTKAELRRKAGTVNLDDAVTRFTCSFGFNGYDYLWGKGRRKLKYLVHQALTLPTLDQRRIAFRTFMTEFIKSGKVTGDDWSIALKEIKNIGHIEQATNLCRLQKVESVMEAKSRESNTMIEIRKGDMFEMDFSPYDVVYFDPPYENTKGYDKSKFDFGKFNELCTALVSSGKHVFISEYQCSIPGFTEVFAVEKQMSQCDHMTKVVTERLFFGGSTEEYESLMASCTR